MTKFINSLLILFAATIMFADSISLNMENDTLSFPKKDHEYSHGTELVYMTDSPFWIFDSVGFGIEQTMYTPPLLKTDDLQLGEHPYCGYLSFNLIGDQIFKLNDSLDLTLEHSLGFGMVGPSSRSEQSQKVIHRWLGCKEPKGWKWQIHDEFIVQYQCYANLNYEVLKYGLWSGYLIPRIGLDAGGFKDMIAPGLDIKLGYNIRGNTGSNMILSAPARRQSKFGTFILAGVEGRCVFHDTSIDGGFFRESIHTEESEMWVGEFHWGIGLTFKGVEIDYFNFVRSNELKDSRASNPNYGRISLKISF